MDSKFKTIGTNNPLDSVIPASQEASEAQEISKDRLTVYLSSELVERIKNIVFWTPGLTLGAFAEEALKKEVEKKEKVNGGPFQPRHSKLKGGRPMK